jgi:hypothetical protein
VTISVTSNDLTEATVDKSSLSFEPGNWETPQVVTVTGVDDSPNIDGNQTPGIVLAVVDDSSDDAFDPLPDQTVTVTVVDGGT